MSFVNSDLPNYEVEFDKNGKPYLRRISERERIRFNRKYRISIEHHRILKSAKKRSAGSHAFSEE
jgi:hypothetical protein